MSFPTDLQAQLDRLSAAGWSREQIAAATGYTRQRLSAWARGPVEPPHALRVGLLSVLRGLRRPPVAPPPNAGYEPHEGSTSAPRHQPAGGR